MVRNRYCLQIISGLVAILLFSAASSLFHYVKMSPVSADAAAYNTPPKEDSDKTLKLMTYNIRHGEGLDGNVDLNRIIKDIVNASPDVVALQEVDRYRWRSGMQDQAKQIAEATGMQMVFAASLSAGPSQYGNALLSRLPIEQSQTVALPGTKEPRSLLIARIDANGQPVTVFATHLGTTKSDRTEQLKLLMKYVREDTGPKVVMGDFNMGQGDVHLGPLFQLVPKINQSSPMPTIRTGQEIDHIGTNVQVESEAETGPISASDHAPVIAAIKL